MLISIQIKDDLLRALLIHAGQKGSTAEAAIDDILRDALDDPDLENKSLGAFLDEAIRGVDAIENMAEFSFDDVLGSENWNRLSGGDRKSLGRSFRKEVERLGIAVWLRRNSANKAIYLKR
jgi:plasmid stability protein